MNVFNIDQDISMIVDASGGTGTLHQPCVNEQLKGEPERAQLLKTKCTFTKVHGVGTMITQTFPTIEKQGNIYCIFMK